MLTGVAKEIVARRDRVTIGNQAKGAVAEYSIGRVHRDTGHLIVAESVASIDSEGRQWREEVGEIRACHYI